MPVLLTGVRLSTYKNLKIVQYDRGSMGEFISLMLHSTFYEPVLQHRKKELNSYNFMPYDGSLDSLLYDTHRVAESVKIQNRLFGTCAYECMMQGRVEDTRNIFSHMTKLRNVYPQERADDLYFKGGYEDVYLESSEPEYDFITRIHNFHKIKIEEYFPDSTIYSVFCPPEKRWIFKFLYFYKKSLDNNTERLKRGLIDFWDFNWNINESYSDRYIMIDCYDLLTGSNLFFNETLYPIIKQNSESNLEILREFDLDHRLDNVASDDLLGIASSFF